MNNQPDPRHHQGGVPIVPLMGVAWLCVVLLGEACCDLPRVPFELSSPPPAAVEVPR